MAGVLVGLGALYGVGYAVTGNTLPAGTSIGGVEVGALSRRPPRTPCVPDSRRRRPEP